MSKSEDVVIREVLAPDLAGIETLVKEWASEPYLANIEAEEVDIVINEVKAFTDGNLICGRTYSIAEDLDGRLLGIMGMFNASDDLSSVSPAVARGKASELVSAFVSPESRGLGIGRLLVKHLENEARDRGHEDIVVASRCKFSETGWPFWKSLYGEPAAIISGSAVWRKEL